MSCQALVSVQVGMQADSSSGGNIRCSVICQIVAALASEMHVYIKIAGKARNCKDVNSRTATLRCTHHLNRDMSVL